MAGVVQGAEWRRIDGLPKRAYTSEQLQQIAQHLTQQLRTPTGTMELFPLQALALWDWLHVQGLVAWLPVGEGKTLVTFLAPSLLPHQRAVLFVPAALLEKTCEDLRILREHWKISDRLIVVSYKKLELRRHADLLFRLKPDMIICDEAQAFRRVGSARSRRFFNYLQAHHQTKVAMLSASSARRSVTDYWHLSFAALRVGSPLPLNLNEVKKWGAVLDSDAPDPRPPPGALRRWCPAEKQGMSAVQVAREGFRARVAATPGYVTARSTPLGVPITLTERPYVMDKSQQYHITHLRRTWERPDGELIQHAPELWRHERELALGCWYCWDPLPPPEWLEPRRAWRAFVRSMLARQIEGLDAPSEVELRYPNHPLLQAWRAVRKQYTPNNVVHWVSKKLLHDATQWLQQGGQRIAWVEHVGVGVALAEMSGYRYLGAGKESAREILTVNGPIIAGIKSKSTGLNLQRYRHNLVMPFPTSGDAVEQLIGRTHRRGQQHPVTVETYLHHESLIRNIKQVLRDASFLSETQDDQRIIRAQKCLPSLDAAED